MIVPVVTVGKMTELAWAAAMRLVGDVVPVAVDNDTVGRLCARWKRWDPAVEPMVLPGPHRDLVAPTIDFVRSWTRPGRDVTVSLARVEPRGRYRLLHDPRGPVFAAAPRAGSDAGVATLTVRVDRPRRGNGSGPARAQSRSIDRARP